MVAVIGLPRRSAHFRYLDEYKSDITGMCFLLHHATLNDTDSVAVLLRFRTSTTKDNWFNRRAELVDDFAEEGVGRVRYPAAVKPARSAEQRCGMGRVTGANNCNQVVTFAAGGRQLHHEA